MPSHDDGILVRAGLSRREGNRCRRQRVGGKERRLQTEPTDAERAVVEPEHGLDAPGQHADRRGMGEPALGGCPRQKGLAVGNREHPYEPRVGRIARLRHGEGIDQPGHDAGLIGSQAGGDRLFNAVRRRRYRGRRRSRCGHRGRCPFRREPRRPKQRQCHGQQKHRHRQHRQDGADATKCDDRTGQRVAGLHPRMGLATARATRKGGLRWHARARVSAEGGCGKRSVCRTGGRTGDRVRDW